MVEKSALRDSEVTKNKKQMIKEKLIPLLLMLIIPIINISYVLLDSSSRGVFSLETPLDRVMPFIEIFVVPYILWYLYIFLGLVYFCMNDSETYYKTILSIIFGLIICYVIFFLFQTTVIRPKIYGDDVVSMLIKAVYGNDKPYNCFPSIHVLTCFIMVKAILTYRKKNKINIVFFIIISSTIILSTLFIKQHVLADVAGGIIIGDLVFEAVSHEIRKPVWKTLYIYIHDADNIFKVIICRKFRDILCNITYPLVLWINRYSDMYVFFTSIYLYFRRDNIFSGAMAVTYHFLKIR